MPSIVLFPSWMKVWRRLACAAASAPAAPAAAQAAPAGPQRLAAQVDRVSWGVTPAELARAQRWAGPSICRSSCGRGRPRCRRRCRPGSTRCRSRACRRATRCWRNARGPRKSARSKIPPASWRPRARTAWCRASAPTKPCSAPSGWRFIPQPVAGADDLVLDEPLQRLRRPGHTAACAGQVPRPAGRHRPFARHADLPGQHPQQRRPHQRELRARTAGAAHPGRARRLQPARRAGTGARAHGRGPEPDRRGAARQARAARAAGRRRPVPVRTGAP